VEKASPATWKPSREQSERARKAGMSVKKWMQLQRAATDAATSEPSREGSGRFVEAQDSQESALYDANPVSASYFDETRAKAVVDPLNARTDRIADHVVGGQSSVTNAGGEMAMTRHIPGSVNEAMAAALLQQQNFIAVPSSESMVTMPQTSRKFDTDAKTLTLAPNGLTRPSATRFEHEHEQQQQQQQQQRAKFGSSEAAVWRREDVPGASDVTSRIGNAHSRTPALRAMANTQSKEDAVSQGAGGRKQPSIEGMTRSAYAKALKAAKPTPPRSARSQLEGEYVVHKNIEIVFQAPPPPRHANGVLLLAHGCHHGATDMFPFGPKCQSCIGLPVETSIVAAALSRDWCVMAVSSHDRTRKCWTEQDLPRLRVSVEYVRARCGLPDRSPIGAIGVSSGGHLVSVLEHSGLSGIVGVVVQMATSGIVKGLPKTAANHLPVRFVHMARDAKRSKQISRQTYGLRLAGADADEWKVNPSPLTVESFGIRDHGGGGGEPALPSDVAEDAIEALAQAGLMDENGYLLQDPRGRSAASDWRAALEMVIPKSMDSLVADRSRVSEVLNVAYAYHEFTDAYLSESLDWLGEARKKRMSTMEPRNGFETDPTAQ